MKAESAIFLRRCPDFLIRRFILTGLLNDFIEEVMEREQTVLGVSAI